MNFLLAAATAIGMTLIPLIVTESLGMSLFLLGLIEGFSEFSSNILRLVSGTLFDRLKNRRLVFAIPALVSFISKSLLCFPSAVNVFLSKIMERMANGWFASPRDAYVGENSKIDKRGLALGILSSSKAAGCVLGPLVVMGVSHYLSPLNQYFSYLFYLCCAFSFTAFILSFYLSAHKIKNQQEKEKFDLANLTSSLKSLSPILIVSVLFFFGRFNDGLIMLFLKDVGFPEKFYVSTIMIFNSVMLVTSPIIGRFIGRFRNSTILIIVASFLLVFNVIFYHVTSHSYILAYFGLGAWGIQRAGAQITFSAMIFKKISPELYGTSTGLFYVISGLAMLIACVVAGYLAKYSFHYIFQMSAAASVLTIIGCYFLRNELT